MTTHEPSSGSNGDPDGDSGVRTAGAGLSVSGPTARPRDWLHEIAGRSGPASTVSGDAL